MIFTSPVAPLDHSHLREELTVPEFLLDHVSHPLRARYGLDNPWLIDNATGHQYGIEEARQRTLGLANAFTKLYGIGENDVVILFSPNDIDYPIVIWALHRLGAIVSCGNPAHTSSELAFQIQETKAKFIVAHADVIPTVQNATQTQGIPSDRLVVIESPSQRASSSPGSQNSTDGLKTVQILVDIGLGLNADHKPLFVEKKLAKGEAKTKVAFLNFSSGTTGKPKAVAISHYNVTSNIVQYATFIQQNNENIPWDEKRSRPGDVSSCSIPMFHVYGLVAVLFGCIFCGVPQVVLPKYNFKDFLESIVKYKITHLWLVPPQMVQLVKQPDTRKYDLGSVRMVGGGAAPVSATLQQALGEVFPNAMLGQGYGTTETPALITLWPLSQNRKATIGSAGQLLPGWEGKILKEDGTFGGYGEPGELLLRGPATSLGYLGNPEATAATFKDGWVHTGDQVIIKPNGDLFVVDRLKEFLKVRGFQVAPAELEGHLIGHPDISDVAIVGIVDDYHGELPVAFVVLQRGAAARVTSNPKAVSVLQQSIYKYVSDRKVRYKWIDGGIYFVDEIPKTPSGKILRRALRDKLQNSNARAAVLKPKL